MNKKYLVAAVGAALSMGAAMSAMAEATLYGSARVKLESCGTCVGTSTALNNDDWVMGDAGSRLGVKGSEDLGGGMSAVYNFEFAVDVDDGSDTATGGFGGGRPHYVGLKGGMGQVTFGRQYQPYYDYIRGQLDIFNENWDFGVGVNGYTSRTSDLIKYVSPTLGGFTVEAAVQVAGGGNGQDLDQLHLGAGFQTGPFSIGGALVKEKKSKTATTSSRSWLAKGAEFTVNFNQADDFDAAALVAGFDFGMGNVKLGYQTTGFGPVSVDFASVVAEFKIGANDTIMVGYEKAKTDGITDTGVTVSAGPYTAAQLNDAKPAFAHVEYQHKLNKKTRVWAAYIDRDVDLPSGSTIEEDPTIQLGMRVDF